MLIDWLFSINGNYWSTKAVNYDSQAYSAKVIPKSWQGITQRYNLDGRLIAPNDITFEISNVDGALSRSDLEGYDLLVQLTITNDYLQDESGNYILDESGNQILAPQKYRKWKFKCKRAVPYYGKMKLYCQDFVQEYLEGSWPNTQHPKEIWPSSDVDTDDLDNTCVPVVFGTAYIPVMSVWTGSNRRYVLGADTAPTYTITEVKTPRDWSGTSATWDNTYTYTTTDLESHKVAELVIADSDGDGTADANGVWIVGDRVLVPLIKFSRSDTSSTTDPADWIEYILEDYGIASADIDTGTGSTFETVSTTLSGRSITWNGGFWKKENREKLLQSLLSQIDGYLTITDKIELHLFSDTSQETFDKTKTIKGSYTSRPITQTEHDGGRVAWVNSGDPQDKLTGKSVVGLYEAQASITSPSNETLNIRFDTDSQRALKLGMLHFAKKYLQKDRISFQTSGTAMDTIDTLTPGQVITCNDSIFGASFDLIVESIQFKKDLTVAIQGVRLSYVEDWADLSASTVVVASDGSSGWYFAVVDPSGVIDEKVNWSKVQDDDTNKPADNADVTLDNLHVITVSPTAGKAQYTSISDALDAVDNDYTMIYLKNGTYTISSTNTLPDYNLTLTGESRDGVVIQGPSAANTFEKTTTVDNFYEFKNLTFDSQTSSAGYSIIRMEEGAFTLSVYNCKFDLWDDGSVNSNGDIGIDVYPSSLDSSSIQIERCTFNKGLYGIKLYQINNVNIFNNHLEAQTKRAIFVENSENVVVSSCVCNKCLNSGIDINGNNSGELVKVVNNLIKFDETSSDIEFAYGLSVWKYDKCVVANNQVKIKNTTSTIFTPYGIYANSFDKGLVSGNTINMNTSCASSNFSTGLRLFVCSNIAVLGNTITIDDSTAGNIYGLSSSGNRATISGNNIDLVNNTADEIGITVAGDNNTINNNITYNCGTAINDTGTNNSVTDNKDI